MGKSRPLVKRDLGGDERRDYLLGGKAALLLRVLLVVILLFQEVIGGGEKGTPLVRSLFKPKNRSRPFIIPKSKSPREFLQN